MRSPERAPRFKRSAGDPSRGRRWSARSERCLLAIGVEEGDVVRAGDVLLVLDPTDMKRDVALVLRGVRRGCRR